MTFFFFCLAFCLVLERCCGHFNSLLSVGTFICIYLYMFLLVLIYYNHAEVCACMFVCMCVQMCMCISLNFFQLYPDSICFCSSTFIKVGGSERRPAANVMWSRHSWLCCQLVYHSCHEPVAGILWDFISWTSLLHSGVALSLWNSCCLNENLDKDTGHTFVK